MRVSTGAVCHTFIGIRSQGWVYQSTLLNKPNGIPALTISA